MLQQQRTNLHTVASGAKHGQHLDVLPVQKVAQLQGSAKHHRGHISNYLQHVISTGSNCAGGELCVRACYQHSNTFARSFCVYVEYHLDKRTLPCRLRSRTNCTACRTIS